MKKRLIYYRGHIMVDESDLFYCRFMAFTRYCAVALRQSTALIGSQNICKRSINVLKQGLNFLFLCVYTISR